jgi:hypothetical protein
MTKKASNLFCVMGSLTDEGVECQAFRSTSNELFTLVGDLNGFENGDKVIVCGTIATVSICMQGTTINVSGICQANEVDNALESSLALEIKSRWSDQFNDDDDVKVSVLYATRRVATALSTKLPKEIEKALQAKVDLSTTPEDALPLMSEALDWPA